MLILTIRTDKPEAELGLYESTKQLAYYQWQAHRELAETIHQSIKNMMDKQKISLKDIHAIVVFKGPGSFTGLRIGISVANAFAHSLKIPIVASDTEDWQLNGIARLQKNENAIITQPEYGSPPHITLPKH